jgi:hypothetical protein
MQITDGVDRRMLGDPSLSMRKYLAFLFLLVGCGTAALPVNPGDASSDADAVDAGPCGQIGERCCAPAEAAKACDVFSPFGCGVEGVCCAIGAGGHCIE